MTPKAPRGTWVEVHDVVLAAGSRAPQAPADTQQVPLEMRVKGDLLHDGSLGDRVEIVTRTGRRVAGTLVEINPAYGQTFGQPVPELTAIAAELRTILGDHDP